MPKFEPDLALQIMRIVETYPSDPFQGEIDIQGADQRAISFHCRLLGEAGYLHVFENNTLAGYYCFPRAITWEGAQFLETFTNETIWEKAKTTLSEKGVGFTLDLLLQMGKQITHRELGIELP